MTMMVPHSKQLQAVMDMLGLPKHVREFTLHASFDALPTVTVTYYPEAPINTSVDPVTAQFRLVPIEQEQK